jgi:hypothetical protein
VNTFDLTEEELIHDLKSARNCDTLSYSCNN